MVEDSLLELDVVVGELILGLEAVADPFVFEFEALLGETLFEMDLVEEKILELEGKHTLALGNSIHLPPVHLFSVSLHFADGGYWHVAPGPHGVSSEHTWPRHVGAGTQAVAVFGVA